MEENMDKICWICLKYSPDASLLPINFGKHCENYQMKWNNAKNKKFGEKKIINDNIIYDYSDDLCAPICFICAH